MTYKHKFAGVYKIENIRNGKIYIGSTGHFYHRKNQHLHSLRTGQHWILDLQKDFNVFGECFFKFVLLKEMSDATKDELVANEQAYIDKLHPEYNQSSVASYGKYEFTDEVKQKISTSVKARWEEGIYDKTHKGINHFLVDGKPNRLGAKLTEEQKQHLSKINSGKNNPNWGTHRSDESRNRTSKSNGRIYFGLVSPDGVAQDIQNMTKFCEEHGLGVSEMVAVARGKRPRHRGWTCIDPNKNQQPKTAKMVRGGQ